MPKGGGVGGSGGSGSPSGREPLRLTSQSSPDYSGSTWDIPGNRTTGQGQSPQIKEELGFNWDLDNIPTTNHDQSD